DPTAHVVIARIAVTAADVFTVIGAFRLAERLVEGSGTAAGVLTAISPIGIATSNSLYVEPFQALFTVWAVERMVVHQRRGDWGSLLAASALVGLAASSKYPGVLLAVPLVWTGVSSVSKSTAAPRLARVGVGLGIAAAAFGLTSPYVFLDWERAKSDL